MQSFYLLKGRSVRKNARTPQVFKPSSLDKGFKIQDGQPREFQTNTLNYRDAPCILAVTSKNVKCRDGRSAHELIESTSSLEGGTVREFRKRVVALSLGLRQPIADFSPN